MPKKPLAFPCLLLANGMLPLAPGSLVTVILQCGDFHES